MFSYIHIHVVCIHFNPFSPIDQISVDPDEMADCDTSWSHLRWDHDVLIGHLIWIYTVYHSAEIPHLQQQTFKFKGGGVQYRNSVIKGEAAVLKLCSATDVNPSPAEHDMSCLCKQCRSRSVCFWRSQLIWTCTVCHVIMWISIYNQDQTIWLAEN